MDERVRVEPLNQRLRVRLFGAPIVDTQRAMVVLEKGLPPRYYVPREDVSAEITRGKGEGRCPWKGQWEHLDLTREGKTAPSSAWTYVAPLPVCEPIRDFICFYPDKMEAIDLG